MTYYAATIEVLVEAENDAEACDVLSETLRPMIKEFQPESAFIDWMYATDHPWQKHTGEGFEYANTASTEDKIVALYYLPDKTLYGTVPLSEFGTYAEMMAMDICYAVAGKFGALTRDGVALRSFVVTERITHHLP